MAHAVAPHHWPPIHRLNHTTGPDNPRTNRESWTDQRHSHACQTKIKIKIQNSCHTHPIGGLRISLYGIVPIIVFLAIALIGYLNYRRKRQK
jgi:hypothetical protein